MPGEKELIPPMVDIMLETGHVMYSIPFLMRYVEKNGWNEVMNQFARHQRLREKWSREGVRFLRFYGQKSSEFRKYIFFHYFEKFMALSLVLFFPVCVVFLYFLAGFFGLAVAVFVFLCTGIIWKTVRHIANRKLS
jgi:hypothetical protein